MKAVQLCSSFGLVAMLGCAPVVSAPVASAPISLEPAPDPPRDPSARVEDGVINGYVKDSDTGMPIADALVMLQCTCLGTSLERATTERGIYSFTDLPPGDYTIQVLIGGAHAVKMTELPKDAKLRANFLIDPSPRDGS